MADISVERIFEQVAAGNVAGAALGAFGDEVVIESQVSPAFRFKLADLVSGQPAQAAPAPGSGVLARTGDALMRVVRPRFTISVAGRRYVVEPWGAPERNYTPWVAAAAVAAGAGAYFIGRRVLKSLKKRR